MNKNKFVWLWLFSIFNLFSELPEPYRSVNPLLPFEPHGWYQNSSQIELLIRSRPIRTVIEVGSWFGASTRHIASLLPPGGKVYAVDHWKGSAEHQPGAPFWHPALPYLYEQFLSNVIHANLTHVIIPVRMNSLEAAKALAHVKPDLIYIDASHDFDSVLADLRAWYPLVKGHGILCGDDWRSGHTLTKAIIIFAEEQNLTIHISGVFWQFVEK